MGNVTIFLPCGNQNVVRAYVQGFVAHATIYNMQIVGQDVTFNAGSSSEFWSFRISDEFFPPSSNVYSLDHVFDAANCFHYSAGVPVPAFVYFGLMKVAVLRPFYLGWNCLAASDEDNHAELPPLTPYWLN